ncbi:MAG TPA: dihydrolipoamide succinyltransferase, partial [Gammaproteobacteria bacterium]|nr:dihydrolipoamide succinyltransferase [Gammaproteobacteria bacterium]
QRGLHRLGVIAEGASAASPATEKPQAEAAETAESETKSNPQTSPAVRRLIAEKGLDASTIVGTGKGGRITKEDVLNHEASQAQKTDKPQADSKSEAKTEEEPAPIKLAPPTAGSVPLADEERPSRRVPMTRLRARIAERLLYAQQSTAMLTTFNEVDMKPLMDMRKNYKKSFEEKHGVRLGFMSMFVKASAEALKRFPDVNASIDDNDVVYHGFCDIGVAVSSDRGLVVPILRNAELMSLAEIERQVGDYGAKARDGKLSIEDMTGGTFTISNGG